MPNDPYMGRTAPRTSKRCILYIYSTNIDTEYFKHALYSPFFSLQNAVCFIMLTCLVCIKFYIQDVLKLKKNNSSAKELNPIFHLLALLGTHHILHVSGVRVNPLNAELNPICHLLALLGALFSTCSLLYMLYSNLSPVYCC